MKALTIAQARKNLRSIIHDVCENSEPALIVSKESSDQAVLISIEDYRSLEETAYLLRTPANRAHLEESLQQVREGKLITVSLEDL
jgi:antitoxin YefM